MEQFSGTLKNLLSGNAVVKTGCFLHLREMNMWKGILMLFFVSGSLVFCSWGFLVHRTTLQLAVYQLPKSVQLLFYKNSTDLVKASVRPDERRFTDSTEAPNHFVDLEMYVVSASCHI